MLSLIYRLRANWKSIKAGVDTWALANGHVTYSACRKQYAFYGFGPSPDGSIGCQVRHWPVDGEDEFIEAGWFS